MPQLGLDSGVPTPVRSGPVVTDPVRSDTPGFTPLSITATVTPRPLVACHAAGALIAFRTHVSALRTVSARAGGAPAVMIRAVTAASASRTAPRALRPAARGLRARRLSIRALRGTGATAAPRPAALSPRRPRRP